MVRRIPLVVLAIAVAACEHETQPLPFTTEAATTRTVPAGGATVSNSAGASVEFPAGAVSGGTTVTITPGSAPAAAQQSGAAASNGFRIEPEGASLAIPAQVELKFNTELDRSRSWLASVVNVTPQGVREIGNSRVDLSTGIVDAPISTLGTVVAVIPDSRAVVQVQALRSMLPEPSLLAATGADSIVRRCGGPANRCTGLSAGASANLLEQVSNVALVYPTIAAGLRITGTAASGRIEASGAVRALLKSGAGSQNVQINAVLTPTSATVVTETASQIILTNVRHQISGGTAGTGSGVLGTLVIPKSGTGGTVSVSRSFQIQTLQGNPERASVSMTFPVQIFQ